jgi:hypothetical protein
MVLPRLCPGYVIVLDVAHVFAPVLTLVVPPIDDIFIVGVVLTVDVAVSLVVDAVVPLIVNINIIPIVDAVVIPSLLLLLSLGQGLHILDHETWE